MTPMYLLMLLVVTAPANTNNADVAPIVQVIRVGEYDRAECVKASKQFVEDYNARFPLAPYNSILYQRDKGLGISQASFSCIPAPGKR